MNASWVPNSRVPFFPFYILERLQSGMRPFGLPTQGKSLCGLILKRATCLFHGMFATLSEHPWSGFTVLEEKMPVIGRL